MAQIYFSSHSYCLLLIITQSSFFIYSCCSFETIVMPFNFQPTIFSRKMQYNRPCKYSRPYSCWLGRSSWSLEKCSWEGTLTLSASASASEFWYWIQVGIDVCIPHRKYQVILHSSPWFSASCAAAIVHRNHFFTLYQQNKSSESKVSSDRLVIVVNGFLKLPNLHMLIKQKSPSLPRNLAPGRLANC